ncbi:hypothetical protein CR513_29404, partial [Mucuna pruriens]
MRKERVKEPSWVVKAREKRKKEMSPKEVRMVLLVKKEPLFAFPYDILPVDISHGLPSLRGIKHHIDLILGASLLNRHAYRKNPKAK